MEITLQQHQDQEDMGVKQDDDLLHNYTVAKALEDVDWEYEPLPYKIISATYHCG